MESENVQNRTAVDAMDQRNMRRDLLRLRNPFRGDHVCRNGGALENHAQFPPISRWEIGGNWTVRKSDSDPIDMVTPKGVPARLASVSGQRNGERLRLGVPIPARYGWRI